MKRGALVVSGLVALSASLGCNSGALVGTPRSITWAPKQLSLTATVAVPGSGAVTLSDDGNASVQVPAVAIVNDDAGAFQISGPSFFPIGAGGSVEVVVTYAPHAVGTNSAQLQVQTNVVGVPLFTVPLQGTCVPESSSSVSTSTSSTAASTSSSSSSTTGSAAASSSSSSSSSGSSSGGTPGSASSSGGVSFGPATTYLTGYNPDGLVVGDFDRDGWPDLVAANGGDAVTGNTITVLRNLRDAVDGGGFGLPLTYTVGGGPGPMAVADFNRDGWPDLAVGNTDGTVSILLNLADGGGGLGPQSVYPTGNSSLDSLTVADFNGDGWPDVAVGGATIGVLFNQGDGGSGALRAPVTYLTADSASVVAADFNLDGWPDLAASSGTSIAISLNWGDGGLGPQSIYPAFPAQAWALAVGDFNRDGWPDLAGAGFGGSGNFPGVAGLFLNAGAGAGGAFEAETTYSAGLDPGSVVVGDFDRDGSLDLAVANEGSNTISVLLSLGTPDGGVGFVGFASQVDFATGQTPESIVAGDFEDTGWLGLAVVDWSNNRVGVYPNALQP